MSCKCKNIIENFQGGDIPLETSFLSPVFFSANTYFGGSIFSGGTNLLDLIHGIASSDRYVTTGAYNIAAETIDYTGVPGFPPFSVDVSDLIFNGNTPSTCIDELYANVLGGCSPIRVVDDMVF